MTYLLWTLVVINLALLGYAIRSLRANGTKLSKLQSESKKYFQSLEKSLRPELLKAHNQLNLAILQAPDFENSKDWKFILSLTSHPARFAALEQTLNNLTFQVLQPTSVVLVIAENDLVELPSSIQAMKSSGQIEIKSSHDLGPGKKLMPLLKDQELPIIVLDDDLIVPPDLTLQLMIQHYQYPKAIIASRAHRVTRSFTGDVEPFTNWQKQTDSCDGPAPDLMATSGAGTLFPPQSLHDDASDENLYRELSFHTDDLWWYFQARRQGTLIRRVPGVRPLEFIPDSQDVGLWNTGNKDRNDENLAKLIARYGDVLQ